MVLLNVGISTASRINTVDRDRSNAHKGSVAPSTLLSLSLSFLGKGASVRRNIGIVLSPDHMTVQHVDIIEEPTSCMRQK
jgi:hypothetical protein